MPRAPKPFLTALYVQDRGWFLAAVVDRTKQAAAARAFGQLEDPQRTTANSLSRYTAEVFFDSSAGTLWMKPPAWTGARDLARGLLPKTFRDLVQERKRSRPDSSGVRMPTKTSDLTFFGPLDP